MGEKISSDRLFCPSFLFPREIPSSNLRISNSEGKPASSRGEGKQNNPSKIRKRHFWGEKKNLGSCLQRNGREWGNKCACMWFVDCDRWFADLKFKFESHVFRKKVWSCSQCNLCWKCKAFLGIARLIYSHFFAGCERLNSFSFRRRQVLSRQ